VRSGPQADGDDLAADAVVPATEGDQPGRGGEHAQQRALEAGWDHLLAVQVADLLGALDPAVRAACGGRPSLPPDPR
jgi:hypothetical protein